MMRCTQQDQIVERIECVRWEVWVVTGAGGAQKLYASVRADIERACV